MKDGTSFLGRGNSEGEGSLVEEGGAGDLRKASVMEQSENLTQAQWEVSQARVPGSLEISRLCPPYSSVCPRPGHCRGTVLGVGADGWVDALMPSAGPAGKG